MMQFPYELGKAIEGLNHEYRQKILLSLNEVDKLSFSEIGEKVDISRPLLANHLKKLAETLLVEHFYEHEVGNEKFSYYRISLFGKTLLENMIGTLYLKRIKTTITLFARIEREETAAVFKARLKPNVKFKMAETSSGERKRPTIVVTKQGESDE
jgi:DNA-binding transcriptional ArsR family regulator